MSTFLGTTGAVSSTGSAASRLKHEPDAVWHHQVLRPVPSSAIELQHDAVGFTRARRFGEVQKDRLEHLLANRVGDVPHRRSGGRLHKAPDIKPFVAVMAKRNGPLAFGRPDPAQDRF